MTKLNEMNRLFGMKCVQKVIEKSGKYLCTSYNVLFLRRLVSSTSNMNRLKDQS
jgi:hypothetical protein